MPVSIDRVVAQQRRRLERLVAGVLDRSEAEDVVQEASDPPGHRPGAAPSISPRLPPGSAASASTWPSTGGGTWRVGDSGPSGGEHPSSHPGRHQPDEEWLLLEDREAVRAILDMLSERHRAVLLLRYSGLQLRRGGRLTRDAAVIGGLHAWPEPSPPSAPNTRSIAMNCPDAGVWRAWLDEETAIPGPEEHLAICGALRRHGGRTQNLIRPGPTRRWPCCCRRR